MRITVHTLARIMSFALLTTFTTSAGVFADDNKTEALSHQDHKALDWPGVYYGFLPCADCVGIKTTLALNKNGTYLTITQYAGKSEREFTEKGKFEWSAQDSTITLTPRKGNSSQRYRVETNRLIQLDSQGKPVTGELAERYVLRRKDMSDTAPSGGGHGH